MDMDFSVIYHTSQAESSHSHKKSACGKFLSMDEGAIFIRNLLTALQESGMSEAELSLRAGLNRRAVTDLREGRVRSPKLVTVFSLSRALNRDPGEMMGLGPSAKIEADLVALLEKYNPEQQRNLVTALAGLIGQSA